MASVRILHASDLHISRRPKLTSALDLISAGTYLDATRSFALVSTYDPSILLHFADFVYKDYIDNHVNQQSEPIDVILFTGDVASTGLAIDLNLALKFIEEPSVPTNPVIWSTGNATLAEVQTPIWLLPGNHDRYRRLLLIGYSPGGTMFDVVFKSYWGPKVKEFPTVTRSNTSVKVIAADFNLKRGRDRSGAWYNRFAQGKVYGTILKALERATLDAKKRHSGPLIILWALHFPPQFPSIPSAMKLINDSQLIDIANNCGVAAVLAGHTHEPVQYRTPNMKFDVFCAGTISQDFAPHGHYFHIIRVGTDDNNNVSIGRENFLFDEVLAKFVQV